MNTRFVRLAPLLALAIGLAGCATNPLYEKPGDSTFGEANRQTMMAEIVNPDPSYSKPLETSGDHAQQAIERYRNGTVQQPEASSTMGGAGGGGGAGVGMASN